MADLGNDAVAIDARGHVMIITINRPEARNEVNRFVHEGAGDALEAADEDANVRAVIVTGAGQIVLRRRGPGRAKPRGAARAQ